MGFGSSPISCHFTNTGSPSRARRRLVGVRTAPRVRLAVAVRRLVTQHRAQAHLLDGAPQAASVVAAEEARLLRRVVRDNIIFANARDGVSINRKDTDNLIAGNHIYGNGRNGVYFNNYDVGNNSHRNAFELNLIENNGIREAGYGFSITGAIHDLWIRNNRIRDTGKGTQRCAILMGPETRNIRIEGNTMTGHPDGDVVHR